MSFFKDLTITQTADSAGGVIFTIAELVGSTTDLVVTIGNSPLTVITIDDASTGKLNWPTNQPSGFSSKVIHCVQNLAWTGGVDPGIEFLDHHPATTSEFTAFKAAVVAAGENTTAIADVKITADAAALAIGSNVTGSKTGIYSIMETNTNDIADKTAQSDFDVLAATVGVAAVVAPLDPSPATGLHLSKADLVGGQVPASQLPTPAVGAVLSDAINDDNSANSASSKAVFDVNVKVGNVASPAGADPVAEPEVFASGLIKDVIDIQSLIAVNDAKQADYAETDDTKSTFVKNKPDFATQFDLEMFRHKTAQHITPFNTSTSFNKSDSTEHATNMHDIDINLALGISDDRERLRIMCSSSLGSPDIVEMTIVGYLVYRGETITMNKKFAIEKGRITLVDFGETSFTGDSYELEGKGSLSLNIYLNRLTDPDRKKHYKVNIRSIYKKADKDKNGDKDFNMYSTVSGVSLTSFASV
ncbi:MAG: hypothetical protein HRU18_28310 [Pseudoalteromonas sp.]|uniref:hypothetical protein n=1 Tax=Pseudoalteromonas sp. TaxID=53249 RepID=UPI001D9CABBA|nr:hypothetical protein [Pseudoalteromonas sp.]NRA82116.1 hypothetical protein [Pseudoalteromonas sp.]